eukprot:CAMPEP_0180229448 /NCGR_PEP_ID=MMETSP0987-20121128/25515_1 /TAXON_ID=697907 /ORGANISM="non described non described, Strain CCMP2293" /LENGTH=394 /DNA_ID=CAMNT_0022194135 /DNA_START=231 /DNA_END=1412 /DNA_ORIENTATION=-
MSDSSTPRTRPDPENDPDMVRGVRGIGDISEMPGQFGWARTNVQTPERGKEGLKGYRLCRHIGEGSFGVVSMGVDLSTGRKCAIKRLRVETENLVQLTQVLREVKLMRHFRDHHNVVSIINVILTPSVHGRRDCFIVTELMQSDLYRVMSSQALTPKHVSFFMYQILRGIKYLHSIKCIHRDIKPPNLLVNQNCDLRICDFGLARVDPNDQTREPPGKSLYVVSRWYRSPELLREREYGVAVDNWAVGCVFAELLRGGRALFPGSDKHDMLRRIGLMVLGSSNALLSFNPVSLSVSDSRAAFLARMRLLLPEATPEATDLLEELLRVHPGRRTTASDALCHPYLKHLHDITDEPNAPQLDPAFLDFEESSCAAEAETALVMQAMCEQVAPRAHI